MILTYFLFSSFLSILSKSENKNLKGKISHIPYFLAPPFPKIAKMAKFPIYAQIKFASRQSSWSSKTSECPI